VVNSQKSAISKLSEQIAIERSRVIGLVKLLKPIQKFAHTLDSLSEMVNESLTSSVLSQSDLPACPDYSYLHELLPTSVTKVLSITAAPKLKADKYGCGENEEAPSSDESVTNMEMATVFLADPNSTNSGAVSSESSTVAAADTSASNAVVTGETIPIIEEVSLEQLVFSWAREKSFLASSLCVFPDINLDSYLPDHKQPKDNNLCYDETYFKDGILMTRVILALI